MTQVRVAVSTVALSAGDRDATAALTADMDITSAHVAGGVAGTSAATAGAVMASMTARKLPTLFKVAMP